MESTSIHPIGVYIKSWQTNIAEWVACRPVYELCTEAERIPRMIGIVCWWYTDAVYELDKYTRKRCN